MNRLIEGALLAAALSGCAAQANVELEGGRFPVTHPVRMDAETTREYVAQIRAIQHIELRALERGYLDDIFVDEGRRVKKGEPMFQIMPVVYQAELQKAAAEAKSAEIEYENTKALADRNVVSPTELALAEAELERARAELELAKVHRDFTSIRAPFDGIMGRLEVRRGSLVEEGELLTTLSDNSQMWVYFNVSEAEYLDYQRHTRSGEPVEVALRMANGEVFDHPGEISAIEADFNNETGNIAFRATFPNPDGLLRHGQTGNVVMTTPLHDVLVIPQKATFDVLDKKFVYTVDDEGVVHAKEITVGEDLPHLFVVRDGLSEDDTVLLEGLRKVRDGQEIETHLEPPDEVLSSLELYAE